MHEIAGANVPAETHSLAGRVKNFLSKMSGGVVLGGEQFVGISQSLEEDLDRASLSRQGGLLIQKGIPASSAEVIENARQQGIPFGKKDSFGSRPRVDRSSPVPITAEGDSIVDAAEGLRARSAGQSPIVGNGISTKQGRALLERAIKTDETFSVTGQSVADEALRVHDELTLRHDMSDLGLTNDDGDERAAMLMAEAARNVREI